MDYPSAVIAKAQQLETLLQRVAAGEPCADLGLVVSPAELARLQAKYVAGGQQWAALLDGRFGHAQCVNSAMRAWLYERKRQEPTWCAAALAAALEQEFGVRVAAGHINRLRRAAQSRPQQSARAPVQATGQCAHPARSAAADPEPG